VTSIHTTLVRFSPAAYAALRMVAGFLFMCHGLQKMFGVLGGNQVELMSQMGAAGVIELVGGSLIAVGLFTSPAAFIASGEMAAAYFLAHLPRGPWPIQNQGELSVLYCFLFLYITTRGGGFASVDSLRRKT
jgi:putative oxidoreductase